MRSIPFGETTALGLDFAIVGKNLSFEIWEGYVDSRKLC